MNSSASGTQTANPSFSSQNIAPLPQHYQQQPAAAGQAPFFPPPQHSAGFSVNPLTGVPDFSTMYNAEQAARVAMVLLYNIKYRVITATKIHQYIPEDYRPLLHSNKRHQRHRLIANRSKLSSSFPSSPICRMVTTSTLRSTMRCHRAT